MPKTNKDISVLYIDDEINNLSSFKATFRREFQVFTAENAKIAKEILKDHDVHIIISDQRMPEMTGIEFFQNIIDEYPEPIRILITGYSDIQAVIDAINKGSVYKYLSKPWGEEQMKADIREAHYVYTLRQDQMEMTDKLIDVNRKLEFIARQNLLS